MTRPRARRALLAALLLAPALAACGIPADDGPREISQDQVPDTPSDTVDVDGDGQARSVDLDSGMSGIQGDGARLAYGQIVCTADALEGVEGVLFTIEGEPVQPPNGQGETGSAPLTCAAYDELRGG